MACPWKLRLWGLVPLPNPNILKGKSIVVIVVVIINIILILDNNNNNNNNKFEKNIVTIEEKP